MPKRIIREIGYCGAYFTSNGIGNKILLFGDSEMSKGNDFSKIFTPS
jgi:hypothetical protein